MKGRQCASYNFLHENNSMCMNTIEATLLTIQSEMDNLAKVIACLAATLEGFERQLNMSVNNYDINYISRES